MNCKQFNRIPLEEVLITLRHLPTRQNEKEAWYLNPFANESEASFKLDKRLNLWFLHSEGIGGNNTDFMQKYLNVSISDVLTWASKQKSPSFHLQKTPSNPTQKNIQKPDYQITGIYELQNQNLKKYLQERGLSEAVYHYIKEVHFTINEKKLYAIGFENQSGGFELRNHFYKGAVLNKDISILQLGTENGLSGNNSIHIDNIQPDTKDHVTNRNAAIFEGFMDALSFIEMKNNFIGDVIVMNSASLVSKVKEQLKNYSIKALFLDNDNTGLKCKSEILKSFPDAVDCSKIYTNHKDLNDYLIYKIGMQAKSAEIGLIFQQQPESQTEYSEHTQQLSIPELQELVSNEKERQEKGQEQQKYQNIQNHRRRR